MSPSLAVWNFETAAAAVYPAVGISALWGFPVALYAIDMTSLVCPTLHTGTQNGVGTSQNK